MATKDTGDLYEDMVQNVVEVIHDNKIDLSLRDIHDSELSIIKRFPCVTVEFDSATEGFDEMGVAANQVKKRIDVTLAITYYHEEWTENTRRKEIRKQMSTLVNVLRRNWDINNFCPRWGSNVDSVTSTDLLSPGGDIISGGRIMLTCSKDLAVTLL